MYKKQNREIVILMSVYKKDNPEHLRLSIESILGQTFNNFMFLIGVDGSIGKDLESVLNDFDSSQNVELHYFKENRGLTAVLNDLIEIGYQYSPNFFARMDADDISYPDRFLKQVDFLNKNQDIDVVGGAVDLMNFLGVNKGRVLHYPLTHNECFKFFATRNPLAHPAVMFRKSYFEKAGKYNEKYKKNQDTEMWFRGFKNGCRFANIEDVVLRFRESDDMLKRRGGTKFAKDILKLRNQINKELNYGLKAKLYGYCYYLMAISPRRVKKILYKLR